MRTRGNDHNTRRERERQSQRKHHQQRFQTGNSSSAQHAPSNEFDFLARSHDSRNRILSPQCFLLLRLRPPSRLAFEGKSHATQPDQDESCGQVLQDEVSTLERSPFLPSVLSVPKSTRQRPVLVHTKRFIAHESGQLHREIAPVSVLDRVKLSEQHSKSVQRREGLQSIAVTEGSSWACLWTELE